MKRVSILTASACVLFGLSLFAIGCSESSTGGNSMGMSDGKMSEMNMMSDGKMSEMDMMASDKMGTDKMGTDKMSGGKMAGK